MLLLLLIVLLMPATEEKGRRWCKWKEELKREDEEFVNPIEEAFVIRTTFLPPFGLFD